ncbi:ubiquitin-protein ligase [Lithospermum erythrorhizon]|uniref:Protein cereblon n=1 Tax=Lithospermum erythrorhizon TaxID=34254 RepID=A0AAV3QCZ5_LITER
MRWVRRSWRWVGTTTAVVDDCGGGGVIVGHIMGVGRSDMLIMSSQGPLGAYVNPHGYVHEVMTLHRVNGLAVIGRPVKEYSWFPGYAWSIVECTTCESQMGWLFSATRKALKPRSFWGIRSSQVSDDAT